MAEAVVVGTAVIPAPGTVLFSQVSTAHQQLTGVEFHHWWKPRKWYKQSWLTETSESQSRCLSTHQYLQSGSLLWIGRGIFVWGHILKHQSNPAFASCSRSQCKGCMSQPFTGSLRKQGGKQLAISHGVCHTGVQVAAFLSQPFLLWVCWSLLKLWHRLGRHLTEMSVLVFRKRQC